MDIVRSAEQLGPMLRAARVQQKLTQADVARNLGVSVQAVSKLEHNAARASFERVHRLCLLLDLQIALQPRAPGVRERAADAAPEW
jgi:HTH-type transcriptional regulator/antitoxin HipB